MTKSRCIFRYFGLPFLPLGAAVAVIVSEGGVEMEEDGVAVVEAVVEEEAVEEEEARVDAGPRATIEVQVETRSRNDVSGRGGDAGFVGAAGGDGSLVVEVEELCCEDGGGDVGCWPTKGRTLGSLATDAQVTLTFSPLGAAGREFVAIGG
jgi:hypothetical protein